MLKSFIHPEHHEKYLMQELISFLYTGKTSHPKYSETDGEWHSNSFFDQLVHSLNGWGSANYNPVAYAIRLLTYKGAKLKETNKVWQEYADAMEETFMGVECLSRIYSPMHILAWLVAAKYGDPITQTRAKKILRFWWLLCRSMSNFEGRCLIVGQRSSGPGKTDVWFLDWMLERALGLGNGRKFVQNRVGTANPQWLDFDIFLKLEDTAKETAAGITNLTLDQVFQELKSLGIKMKTIYTWCYKPGCAWKKGDWFWVFTDRSINSNTAPILGVYSRDNGVIDWLPKNGGIRVRQKNDKTTCVYDSDSSALVYTGVFTGKFKLPVPRGRMISSSTYTWTGQTPVPEPDPQPENPTRPTIKRGSIWKRLFEAWVEHP